MQNISSQIKSVTVYGDRAQIIREARVSLSPGARTLVLEDLPVSTDENSVQVNGTGNALLRDVSFAPRHLTTETSSKLETLLRQREALGDQIKETEDAIERVASQKEFVHAITTRITGQGKGAKTDELSPDKWIEMLDFQTEQLQKLDRESRDLMKTHRTQMLEAGQLDRVIQDLKKGSSKTRKALQLEISTEKEEELTLKVSYVVNGASWYPVYDIRVDTSDKKVSLGYKAMVVQKTGEEWSGVKLALSTAQPQISGTPPEIFPRYLRKYSPPKPVVRSAPMSKKMASRSMENFDMDMEESMVYAAAEPMVERPAVSASSQITSTIFEVTGATDIPGDNQPHQVMLLQTDMQAEFSWLTVPRLSANAYLKAEVTNDSDFPLLAGQANIFMDGHFVAKTNLDFVVAGESFEVSLGVDESIKVEHKVNREFQKTDGFISKKKVHTYAYLILVHNRKSIPVKMIVKEGYPVSQDDDIKVELLEPRYQGDTEELIRDDQNILTLTQEVSPGEKWKISLKYEVSYPKDLRVEGL